MAIKDKDGNVYKLRGPNPLMQNQREWDRSKMQLINLSGWKSEIVTDERVPSNVLTIHSTPPEAKVISARAFLQDIQLQESESEPEPEPESEPEPEPESEPEPELSDETERVLKEKGSPFYCAPVVATSTTDDLYGEVYHRLRYGEKYLFNAVVIDENDLGIQIWCAQPITENSIILRKTHLGDRWWKIKQVEQKTGGYLAVGIPSDISPDFS